MNSLAQKKRLQVILREAGIASRRAAEDLIVAGRVRVNGNIVNKLGTQVDPELDRIEVDERPLPGREHKVYYLFHKPENVMVTRQDPQRRPTIYDYLKDIPERINPVGRLDFDSEGLLLLTNDGDLHLRMTHPRHKVPKTYHVKVTGEVSQKAQDQMRKGMAIGEDQITMPCSVRVLKKNPHNVWLEVVLWEGKNRQVRRMIEALGHNVLRLVRVAAGSLHLGDLPKGKWRELTPQEIRDLKLVLD